LKDLRGHDFTGADLRGADLRMTLLSCTSLKRADLRGADLRGAELTDADLSYADVRGGRLDRAILHRTDFCGANLIGASLDGAMLGFARFDRASLTGVSMAAATVADSDFTNADLTGANLTFTSIARVQLSGATLRDARIYGCTAWDIHSDGAHQSDLIITREGDVQVTVDDLETAQLLYAVLRNENVGSLLENITKKLVLVLGRFTPARKAVLDAIRDRLRTTHGYVPVLFDFEQPPSRDTQETVVTIAHLARFIIADLTDPRSIPQELAAIVPNLPSVPVVPLLEEGAEPWGMWDHLTQYRSVLPTHRYASLDALITSLGDDVVRPAETWIASRV
jgi:hypothetical protein